MKPCCNLQFRRFPKRTSRQTKNLYRDNHKFENRSQDLRNRDQVFQLLDSNFRSRDIVTVTQWRSGWQSSSEQRHGIIVTLADWLMFSGISQLVARLSIEGGYTGQIAQWVGKGRRIVEETMWLMAWRKRRSGNIDLRRNVIILKWPQLLHQPLHIYKIYKIYTLKKLRHVSVLRPCSGSYIFLAKVTLEIVTC